MNYEDATDHLYYCAYDDFQLLISRQDFDTVIFCICCLFTINHFF